MLVRSLGIIAFALIALEMVGIVLVWGRIGAWTLAWLAADVVLGVWLLRRAHAGLMSRVMTSMAQGHAPMKVVLAGAGHLLAGLLFMFPGFGSDLLAVLLLLWGASHPAPPSPPPSRPGPPPGRGDAIEGEFRRMD